MTKLVEWLTVLGTVFFLWLALVTNKLENEFTKRHPDVVLWYPVIFLVAFGICAAAVVLYRTLTFNDCEEAAIELQEEIKKAKQDLKRLGFKFKEEIKA